MAKKKVAEKKKATRKKPDVGFTGPMIITPAGTVINFPNGTADTDITGNVPGNTVMTAYHVNSLAPTTVTTTAGATGTVPRTWSVTLHADPDCPTTRTSYVFTLYCWDGTQAFSAQLQFFRGN
jgi:hypothetical protein